jgi:hypothetical protein
MEKEGFNGRRQRLTCSIMQTKEMRLPLSTWYSLLPKMKASGCTTVKSIFLDMTPFPVASCKETGGKRKLANFF